MILFVLPKMKFIRALPKQMLHRIVRNIVWGSKSVWTFSLSVVIPSRIDGLHFFIPNVYIV